jgi:Astacin (Peptidase family M12A)
LKYLNTIKFAAKVLAFTQISAYVYAVDSNLNDKYEIIDDMLFKKADKRTKIAAPHSGQFWKEGKVYYTFSAETPFDDEYKQTIKEAMNDLSNIANIKFIEESNDDINNRENYITIIKDNTLNCSAHVGPFGKNGVVQLDPNRCKKAPILHEFMHTLGFKHEHQRFDQAEYLTFILKNIKEVPGEDTYRNIIGEKTNRNDFTDVGIGYDVDSIMHYDSYHFSLDPEGMPIEQYTRPTILRKDGINGRNYTSCQSS